jgi:hypothetical protein
MAKDVDPGVPDDRDMEEWSPEALERFGRFVEILMEWDAVVTEQQPATASSGAVIRGTPRRRSPIAPADETLGSVHESNRIVNSTELTATVRRGDE